MKSRLFLISFLLIASLCYAQSGSVDLEPLKGDCLSSTTTVNSTGSAEALPSTALSGRKCVLIYNSSSTVTCYIGDTTVTTSDGIPLLPNASMTIDASDQTLIYGVTSSSTADIRTLEIR